MAELKALKIKRGSLKAQVTNFEKFIVSPNEKDVGEIRNRVRKLEEQWKAFQDIQIQIEILSQNKDEIDIEIEQANAEDRREFEDRYFELERKAKNMMQELETAVKVDLEQQRPPGQPILAPPVQVIPAELAELEQQSADQPRIETVNLPAIQQTTTTQPVATEQVTTVTRTNVKLPTLSLPTFNGEYDKWLFFKDSFMSLIHENASLTAIQKFQYLRSSLTEEALQITHSLKASAENYEIAWELLLERYEDKRRIVTTHVRKLLEFPSVTKDDYAAMRNFVNHIKTNLRELEALGQPVTGWDALMIPLATAKLDYKTRQEWEDRVGETENKQLPKIQDLLTFLNKRSSTIEAMRRGTANPESAKPFNKPKDKRVTLAATKSWPCKFCPGQHSIYRCEEFLKLPIRLRIEEAKKRNWCLNCLSPGHYTKDCKVTFCRECDKPHNTLLHLRPEDYPSGGYSGNRDSGYQDSGNRDSGHRDSSGGKANHPGHSTNKLPPAKEGSSAVAIYFLEKETSSTQILLATAQVLIQDAQGRFHRCRALLDPGSQSHLITRETVQRLGLPTEKENQPISGINQTHTSVHQSTSIKMCATHGKFKATMNCLVLPKITEKLPQIRVETARLSIPSDVPLADPLFDMPGTIDLLIGAGLFWNLLCQGQIRREKGQPTLQKTRLGWVIGGEIVNAQTSSRSTACHLVTALTIDRSSTLDRQLERFFKQEEIGDKQETNDEAAWEEQFKSTHERQNGEKFIVHLPKKQDVILGESEEQALRRLHAMERRFQKQPEKKKEYIKFMKEYETSGHMSKISIKREKPESEVYFIPHHPIVRPDSLSTKLRVVFDASAKTTTGNSLNDKLAAGPNIQRDLLNIILRFRTHEYVLTADIEKMFRQVLVHQKDRDLQRVLWREDPTEAVSTYVLNTVTYGTTCAPYLAMRCLRELASNDGRNYPLAGTVLDQDFYMDDVLTGAVSLEEVIELRKQLTRLLACGGFNLRKWRANDPAALAHLADDYKSSDLLIIDKQEALKTLGLLWDANSDVLQYRVNLTNLNEVTKRNVLSQTAQIYDPLGLIGPVLIRAKILMQQLWQGNWDWDEKLPESLEKTWITYRNSLVKINDLRIPRNVNPRNLTQEIEIHGFGDASERGYGACIYAVSSDPEGKLSSHLICSKSRVAPLKTISLPRLELNAALLLSKLIELIQTAFGAKIANIYLWSDSTVVLGWINTEPHRLKNFVANRVTEIQNLTSNASWQHVPSKENPADMLSRGMATEDFLEDKLWWNGPAWIIYGKWPEQPDLRANNVPEMKPVKPIAVLAAIHQPLDILLNVLSRVSSYQKLRRIIAYCHRFRKGIQGNEESKQLTVEELHKADISIARMVQMEIFQEEIKDITAQRSLKKGSKLYALSPFLDRDGLLRVGGRLRNTELPFGHRHPIILPSRHKITEMIMRVEHVRLLHCGAEQLLCSVRQNYWPLSGRREAQKVTRSCINCFRYNPQTAEALMADLPRERVTGFVRPFSTCGMDYAGPLQIRESKRRGRIHILKGYVAVFTCFSTKAVHLELVSDLTTEAFIAALTRFTSRRGLCNQLYSDNGTNFIGANRELHEIYEFLAQKENEICNKLAQQRMTWNFIPPRAPHFGGLWEAAVKATKRHLKIVTKMVIMTFEECYTLLTGIESILNSRPLTPLSIDPNDLSVLTPSHFLIGDSLLEPPQYDYTDVLENRLSRWQHIQQIRQHFWKRWVREYLNQLQLRYKWTSDGTNLKLGTMVLMKEDNVPPLYWPLGRICEIHPGTDGVVRVATIKTSSGLFKRPITKLCPLPVNDDT